MKEAQRQGTMALERATAAEREVENLRQRMQEEVTRSHNLNESIRRANENVNQLRGEREQLQQEYQRLRQEGIATKEELAEKRARLEQLQNSETRAQRMLEEQQERFSSELQTARTREQELRDNLQQAQREAAEQAARAERSTGRAEELRQQLVNTNVNVGGLDGVRNLLTETQFERLMQSIQGAGRGNPQVQDALAARIAAIEASTTLSREQKQRMILKESSIDESAKKESSKDAEESGAASEKRKSKLFAEDMKNINEGIGGMFASGAFMNILFAVVIVLLIYIVLQFFAFV